MLQISLAIPYTNIANQAGFKTINIDEEINGFFIASNAIKWRKSEKDSIENIEKTYKGIPPHL